MCDFLGDSSEGGLGSAVIQQRGLSLAAAAATHIPGEEKQEAERSWGSTEAQGGEE